MGKGKVLMVMSGGIDSTVAAPRLGSFRHESFASITIKNFKDVIKKTKIIITCLVKLC